MAFWITILISASITSISATGLFLQIRSGQLNVGMAPFVGIGGYVSGALSIDFGISPWVTIPTAIIVAFFAGMLFSALTLRLHHWFFAVTTLTLSVAAVSGVGMIGAFGGPTGLTNIPIFTGPALAFGALAVVIVLAYLIERSEVGLAIKATGDDEVLSQIFGVRVRRLRIVVFGVGTAIGALAGALYAHRFGIYQPSDLSVQNSLLLLVFVIVGGKRHLLGPVLGTFFLFVMPEVIKIAPETHLLVLGALLILVATSMPDGIVGALVKGGRWVSDLAGAKRREGNGGRHRSGVRL